MQANERRRPGPPSFSAASGSWGLLERQRHGRQVAAGFHQHQRAFIQHHSRRALAVFRDVWPEVAFGVHPVYAGATFTARFRIYEMGYIFSEYVKTLWYMVRYGIA